MESLVPISTSVFLMPQPQPRVTLGPQDWAVRGIKTGQTQIERKLALGRAADL